MKPSKQAANKAALLLEQLDKIRYGISAYNVTGEDYKRLMKTVTEDGEILRNLGQYFGFCHNRILKRIAENIPVYKNTLGNIIK
jgi:hypothetical protein